MKEHDELIADARAWTYAVSTYPGAGYFIQKLIVALEATKPRTVSTVEELDALPKWAVVLSDEIAYQRGYDYWDGLGREWGSDQIDLPAVVLYAPEVPSD